MAAAPAVPPRSSTLYTFGLFLRTSEPGVPLCVFLLRDSSSHLFGPFRVRAGKLESRSSALARTVRAQTGLDAAALLHVHEPSPFSVFSLPTPTPAAEGGSSNVFVCQVRPFAPPSLPFLPLATSEFEAHRSRVTSSVQHLRGGALPVLESLGVDTLHSVPVAALLALSVSLRGGAARPPSVSVRDYHGIATPLEVDFVEALTHARMAEALSVALEAEQLQPPSPRQLTVGGAGAVARARHEDTHPRSSTEGFVGGADMHEILSAPARGGGASPFRLLVGSITAAHNLGALRRAGVTHIVNCAAADLVPGSVHGLMERELPCCHGAAGPQDHDRCKPAHWAPYASMGLIYAVVYAEETGTACQAIEVCWPAAFALMRDAWAEGGTVLVHCAAGVNRSVTTAAVFMVLHGFARSLADAVELIRLKRPAVRDGNDDAHGARVAGPWQHWLDLHAAPFIKSHMERDVSCRTESYCSVSCQRAARRAHRGFCTGVATQTPWSSSTGRDCCPYCRANARPPVADLPPLTCYFADAFYRSAVKMDMFPMENEEGVWGIRMGTPLGTRVLECWQRLQCMGSALGAAQGHATPYVCPAGIAAALANGTLPALFERAVRGCSAFSLGEFASLQRMVELLNTGTCCSVIPWDLEFHAILAARAGGEPAPQCKSWVFSDAPPVDV